MRTCTTTESVAGWGPSIQFVAWTIMEWMREVPSRDIKRRCPMYYIPSNSLSYCCSMEKGSTIPRERGNFAVIQSALDVDCQSRRRRACKKENSWWAILFLFLSGREEQKKVRPSPIEKVTTQLSQVLTTHQRGEPSLPLFSSWDRVRYRWAICNHSLPYLPQVPTT